MIRTLLAVWMLAAEIGDLAAPAEPTDLMLREERVWLGTARGLYARDPRTREPWRLVLARDDVRALAQGDGGGLAVAGGRLYEWRGEAEPREVALGAGADAFDVAGDPSGAAWVASASGLWVRAPGASEFARELSLPAGEVLRVARAGDELWIAREGELWRMRGGEPAAPIARDEAPGWWSLCGAARSEAGTVLCVPDGLWIVDARGARRAALSLGELRAVAREGESLFVAGELGVHELALRAQANGLELGPPTQRMARPARGLALARGALVVATESGVETIPLRATPPREEPPPGIVRAPLHRSRVAALQRAVLDYLELSPRRLTEVEERARRTGWYPELRASLVYDRDASRDAAHDEVFTSGEQRQLFDSGREQNRGYGLDFAFIWDFSQFAAPEHALSVSRERRLVISLRDQVLERVNHLYFERLRIAAQVRGVPRDDPARVELELRAAELAAQLDAWSGGAFSRLEIDSP